MDEPNRAPDEERPTTDARNRERAGTHGREGPSADASGDPAAGSSADPPADDERPKSAVHVATEGESWLGPGTDAELTPGSPSVESVAFVLLGVVVTLGVLAQFVL